MVILPQKKKKKKKKIGRKRCWRPPPYPPPAECRFQGWRNAQREILPGYGSEVLCTYLVWCGRRGATGGGGGQGVFPPMIFFFCSSAQRSVMAMVIIPLSHYDNFIGTFLKSEKMCRSPPPPPPLSDFFRGSCNETFLSPPPPSPSKHPGAGPCSVVW